MLFYMLFPTIILMFTFPTQIIVTLTTVTAYLFATTIFFASIIKLHNFLKHKSGNKRNNNESSQQKYNQKSTLQTKQLKRVFTGVLFIISWLIVACLHILLFFILYSLLIGRGSVINTGPLFVISLLPSALLSGGAWIAKRVTLNDPKSTDEELQNELKGEKTKSEWHSADFLSQSRVQVLPHETKKARYMLQNQ